MLLSEHISSKSQMRAVHFSDNQLCFEADDTLLEVLNKFGIHKGALESTNTFLKQFAINTPLINGPVLREVVRVSCKQEKARQERSDFMQYMINQK